MPNLHLKNFFHLKKRKGTDKQDFHLRKLAY